MLSAIAYSALALSPLASKFDAWKRSEGKTYATVEEESAAFNAFSSNDDIIRETNSKNLSYKLAITPSPT